jgi:ubiquinone/menaquinone biosynthesis C-methylase UbiE
MSSTRHIKGNGCDIKEINWDNTWTRVRQNLPLKIDYNKYHQYWHMHQLLERFIKRGSSVLECGCATAQFLIYFAAEYDCEIWGIDNSTTGLDISKKNFQMQGINEYTLINADVNYLPLCDNTFDVIFSAGLLEHFSEPEKMVKEMARILKPGGLLIIQIPNFHTGSLMWLIEDIVFRREMSETHVKLDLNDVNSWLLEQNLRIISSEYIGLYVRHGRIPKAEWTLKFINRYTAHSIISIGMKSEEV